MTRLPFLSPEQPEVEIAVHDPHCVLSLSQLYPVVEVFPNKKGTVLPQLDAITVTVDDPTDCSLQNINTIK